MTNANQEAIEAWNTVLFDKFRRFKDVATAGLAQHGEEALRRHPPARGSRVVDLGCGFGDSTVAIARDIGDGQVVGVDAAARFIEEARVDAKGVANARFEVADVQADSLGGPYDYAFSRFGLMFCSNPVQTFRNIKASLREGGTLCVVVWRKREDNDWVHIAENVVRELVTVPERNDAVTCGPGPFSMASADVVSDQLKRAGFTRATFERYDNPITIGRDADNAIDFAMSLGPAGEVMRLAGAEGEAKKPTVIAALRRAFESHVTPDGVRAGSSVWIVTARA